MSVQLLAIINLKPLRLKSKVDNFSCETSAITTKHFRFYFYQVKFPALRTPTHPKIITNVLRAQENDESN